MKNSKIKISIFILIISILASAVFAVAPSDEVIAKWKSEGTYDVNMAILDNFKARGGCSPVEHPQLKNRDNLALGTEIIDTVKVLVILVHFTDNAHSIEGTPAAFDSILFSDSQTDTIINPTGSMTDFYMENSYGTFYVQGDVTPWYMMTQTYATYAGDSYGFDGAVNAQDLAEDAVLMASGPYDISDYDNNNDGYCDGIIVIHAGPGAEQTGYLGDIWSHKFNLKSPLELDGVWVTNYTMNPELYLVSGGSELSPIGVFCHEYGHFIGLPDLYDTNDNPGSEGIGRWGLMASGNYNGNSKRPSHFCAWCKEQLGFITYTELTQNQYQIEIPQIETNPVAFKLTSDSLIWQYWIVENRQKTLFDDGLPGEGLVIYHIDESRSGNTDPDRYMVAIEQADGNNSLAFDGSRGDASDPWPGFAVNRNFHEFSVPNSIGYPSIVSEVGVWNISDSDSLMYADLDVNYSRPWVELSNFDSLTFDDSNGGGNGDGYLDAGETIRFYFRIKNLMRRSYNVHATLTSSNPDIQFTTGEVTVPGTFIENDFDNGSYPIEFTLPSTLTPSIDSFYLSLSIDSLQVGFPGGESYNKVIAFDQVIGKPNIVILDDDRGDTYEEEYQDALYASSVPSETWDINSSGLPTVGDLTNYDMVFWHTGIRSPGSITAGDIALMKTLMDNGTDVFFSTISGMEDIMSLDPDFMRDYFHAEFTGRFFWPIITGASGHPVSENTQYIYDQHNLDTTGILNVVGQGTPIFTFSSSNHVCGVAYDGDYKSILLSYPLELNDNSRTPDFNTTSDMLSRVVDFFGGVATSISDGSFSPIPQSFELTQNYPNPFNPMTTIRYTIRSTENIGEKAPKTQLLIYNIIGREVKTLVDKVQSPGNYEVSWDGTDHNGNPVSTGIYFYRLIRGDEAESRKMTLLK